MVIAQNMENRCGGIVVYLIANPYYTAGSKYQVRFTIEPQYTFPDDIFVQQCTDNVRELMRIIEEAAGPLVLQHSKADQQFIDLQRMMPPIDTGIPARLVMSPEEYDKQHNNRSLQIPHDDDKGKQHQSPG